MSARERLDSLGLTRFAHSAGRPAQGPWSSGLVAPVDDVNRVLEMDRTLDDMRHELGRRATAALAKGMHAPLVMSLLILNW